MKPKLLKSFIFVVCFWFLITTLYWASTSDTAIAVNAVNRIVSIVPSSLLPDHEFSNGIMGAIFVQAFVLKTWTFPILVVGAVAFILGFLISWKKAADSDTQLTKSIAPSNSFRGLNITLGRVPLPIVFDNGSVDIDATSEDSPFKGLQEKHLAVLSEIFAVLMANSDSFSGEVESNLDLAMDAVNKALTQHKNPGEAAIVAAAAFLGNITYWKKVKEEWVISHPLKIKDKESATVLASLSSWYALPDFEKSAILMAVRFKSTPKLIPSIAGQEAIAKEAKSLLYFADDVEKQVIAESRQKVLDNTNISDIILDTFLKSLPLLSFQHKGLPKGVQAVAWKIGKRVFLIEIKLRESMLQKLPVEIKNSLTALPKGEKVRVQPFTFELLKALQEKGWLVTEIDGMKVSPKEGLWNVKAGKLEFKGVIILDIPDELISQLPRGDSMYDVAVIGTLFSMPNKGAGNHHPHSNSSEATPSEALDSSPPAISKDALFKGILNSPK